MQNETIIINDSLIWSLLAKPVETKDITRVVCLASLSANVLKLYKYYIRCLGEFSMLTMTLLLLSLLVLLLGVYLPIKF